MGPQPGNPFGRPSLLLSGTQRQQGVLNHAVMIPPSRKEAFDEKLRRGRVGPKPSLPSLSEPFPLITTINTYLVLLNGSETSRL